MMAFVLAVTLLFVVVFAEISNLRKGTDKKMSALSDQISAINDETNAIAAGVQTVAGEQTTLASEVATLQAQLASALANNQAPTQADMDALASIQARLHSSSQQLSQVATQLQAIGAPSAAPVASVDPGTTPTST